MEFSVKTILSICYCLKVSWATFVFFSAPLGHKAVNQPFDVSNCLLFKTAFNAQTDASVKDR